MKKEEKERKKNRRVGGGRLFTARSLFRPCARGEGRGGLSTFEHPVYTSGRITRERWRGKGVNVLICIHEPSCENS